MPTDRALRHSCSRYIRARGAGPPEAIGELVNKASEFLGILAKNRNGTEGTEILGIPVPVTGTLGLVSRLDSAGRPQWRQPSMGTGPRTARRARVESSSLAGALSWTSSGGGYEL